MITLISSKNLGGDRNMNNTVFAKFFTRSGFSSVFNVKKRYTVAQEQKNVLLISFRIPKSRFEELPLVLNLQYFRISEKIMLVFGNNVGACRK